MAIWLLVHGGNARFEAGTVLGLTDKMPVPLSSKELAAGMRWVAINDATMDDVAAIEGKVSRQIAKGLKIPLLYDSGNELISKSKAQVLAATQATATPGLGKAG